MMPPAKFKGTAPPRYEGIPMRLTSLFPNHSAARAHSTVDLYANCAGISLLFSLAE